MLGALALVAGGCAERSSGEAELAAQTYDRLCAGCHDVEGGIGTRLDARTLGSYGSARRLYNYVRVAMPYDAPRTLSSAEYWLTVGHLIRSRGLAGPDAIIDEHTADAIVFESPES